MKIKHISHFSLPPQGQCNEVQEIKPQFLHQTFLVLYNYSTQRRQQLLLGDENSLHVTERLDPNALGFVVRNTANGSTAIITSITPSPSFGLCKASTRYQNQKIAEGTLGTAEGPAVPGSGDTSQPAGSALC